MSPKQNKNWYLNLMISLSKLEHFWLIKAHASFDIDLEWSGPICNTDKKKFCRTSATFVQVDFKLLVNVM